MNYEPDGRKRWAKMDAGLCYRNDPCDDCTMRCGAVLCCAVRCGYEYARLGL